MNSLQQKQIRGLFFQRYLEGSLHCLPLLSSIYLVFQHLSCLFIYLVIFSISCDRFHVPLSFFNRDFRDRIAPNRDFRDRFHIPLSFFNRDFRDRLAPNRDFCD
jgi:hypothetical protein